MSNYLITGLSGTGKTTLGSILKSRGYRVIEADTEFVRDKLRPWDGKPWEWDRNKIRKLLPRNPVVPVFVVGGAENQREFLRYFKRVFELTVPRHVMKRRLGKRVVAGGLRTKEHHVSGAHRVSTTRSKNAAIYEILRAM